MAIPPRLATVRARPRPPSASRECTPTGVENLETKRPESTRPDPYGGPDSAQQLPTRIAARMIIPAIGGSSLFLAATGTPAPPLPPQAGDKPAARVETASSRLGWPDRLGSGAFTSCLSAQMQPEPFPDGLAVRGDTLVHLPKLGFFSSFVPLRGGVSDMTSIPGGGRIPGTNALVSAGRHGLECYTWDPGSGDLQRSSVDARSMLGSQVRAGDRDDDGQGDLLAELVIGNAGAADLETHYGVAPLASLSGSSDLSWAWPQELDTWQFADDSSNLPPRTSARSTAGSTPRRTSTRRAPRPPEPP